MAVKCILTGQTPSVLDGVTENVQTQLNDKVDKVTGKGLSTNDYTNAEKTKLSGIEAGAQKNTITGVKGSAETTYRTGNVNITATNIGLGNVDNTSDANKPISTATKTALDGKQAKITGAATTITDNNLIANRALISNSSGKVEVSAVTSTELGYLDGVTSNIQTQLNNKLSSAPVTSVNNKTGAVTLTKGDVGLGNVDNTSDANKPISNATQTALNDKQSKITANGILKGDGTGTITAADETEVELVDLPIRAESITIPKGRMRGDVDGDGKITENDINQIQQHSAGTVTLAGVDLWCADVNVDNKVNTTDINIINKFLLGQSGKLTSTPTFADYYNNWTYVKVDDLTGYWTTEISIADLTTSNNVVVNICETFPMGQFYKAEVLEGKIKIYANRPSVNDIPAIVVISSGSGKGSIPSYLNESSVQPEIFWATYGQTTQEEMLAAQNANKLILCAHNSHIFILEYADTFWLGYAVSGGSASVDIFFVQFSNGNWVASNRVIAVNTFIRPISLPAASWTGSDPYTQSITMTGVSSDKYTVDILPSEELYDQLVADNVGFLAIKNVNGTLTAVAKGGKPSVDLTVQARASYNAIYAV